MSETSFYDNRNWRSGLNSLCEGLKLFFKHVAPYMEYMTMLLRQKKTPALVMDWAQARRNS